MHAAHRHTLYLPFAVLFLFTPIRASAQFEGLEDLFNNQIPGVGNPLILEMTPSAPGPNEEVSVRAQSFSLDLNRATITWRVNGTLAAQGIGATDISFTTGEIGSATTVSVTATESGATYTTSLTVRPTAVDLLWQASSYTPPFYRGKALPSSESVIRVIATPQIVVSGRRIPAGELVYTWKIGNRIIERGASTGKNIIEIEGPHIFETYAVRVSVETLDGSVTALGSANIRAVQPQIVFYENDPLLGIRYERALPDTFELTNDEVRITAHPYYFTGANRTDGGEHTFTWTIDGRDVANPLADQSSIILRQTGGAGTATVALMIQNVTEILQRARETLTVTFSGMQQP
jgi:hypothetical protein